MINIFVASRHDKEGGIVDECCLWVGSDKVVVVWGLYQALKK
jgi:hypothetical protein